MKFRFKQCSEDLEHRTRKYILCFLCFKQCSEGLELMKIWNLLREYSPF